jgi:tRNA (uracil-5-)-methyltransferase TRM9
MQQQQQPKPKSKSRRGHPKSEPAELSAPLAVAEPPPVFQRYYHLFVAGELSGLASAAAEQLELVVGPKPSDEDGSAGQRGVFVSLEGWERSNLYVELTRWTT